MPSTPKKQPTSATYRYVGSRAAILESGQPVGPGDYVDLTADDFIGTNNITQLMLDEGALIDATGATTTPEAQATSTEEAAA